MWSSAEAASLTFQEACPAGSLCRDNATPVHKRQLAVNRVLPTSSSCCFPAAHLKSDVHPPLPIAVGPHRLAGVLVSIAVQADPDAAAPDCRTGADRTAVMLMRRTTALHDAPLAPRAQSMDAGALPAGTAAAAAGQAPQWHTAMSRTSAHVGCAFLVLTGRRKQQQQQRMTKWRAESAPHTCRSPLCWASGLAPLWPG